jgi:hypothetical protein
MAESLPYHPKVESLSTAPLWVIGDRIWQKEEKKLKSILKYHLHLKWSKLCAELGGINKVHRLLVKLRMRIETKLLGSMPVVAAQSPHHPKIKASSHSVVAESLHHHPKEGGLNQGATVCIRRENLAKSIEK